jgi:pyridoxal kinase
MSHNNQKKIAIINDISGFGRCSIAVELPIISVMKIQACPLPTSVFSNHTGFESFFFDDYTDKMDFYMNEWKKLDLRFNGICTGFLGSKEQIVIVEKFFELFRDKNTLTIIDPVMGDYGKLYATYNMEMCLEMKKLVGYADVITPNLTEACILTDTEYHEDWTFEELEELVEKLAENGPDKIVITGITMNGNVENFCYEKGEKPYVIVTEHIGKSRSGTGDIFAAIIAADAVNGVDFKTSVKKAADFISKCILRSIEMDLPLTDGVCFEEFLAELGVEK